MKKKTPLKQMDAGLVQAYTNAAMSGVPKAGGGFGGAMDSLMGQASGVVDKVWAKKNQEKAEEKARVKAAKDKGDKVVQTVLDMGGSLGKSTFDSCYPAVEAIQEEYDAAVKSGDKKATAMAMQKLNEFSVTTSSLKELNQDVAAAYDASDLSANVKPGSREDLILTSFMDDATPKRVSKNEGGMQVFEYEVEVDGVKEWVTNDDVNSILTENKTDHTSIADLRDLVIGASDSAKDLAKSGRTESEYDAVKTTSKINSILKKGNLNSLLYDDVMGEGEPFSEAIKSNPEITNMSYESLGMTLNADGVMEMDTNGDGVMDSSFQDDGDGIISEEEKKTLLEGGHQDMIIDALINPKNDNFDEERTRGVMANFYGKVVQKNYDKNLKSSIPLDHWLGQL